MIFCDMNKREVKIAGSGNRICGELELVIRKINEILSEQLGKEKVDAMMCMIFSNAMLSDEERIQKAFEDARKEAGEIAEELATNFRDFLKNFHNNKEK